jgi:hypothetical protein
MIENQFMKKSLWLLQLIKFQEATAQASSSEKSLNNSSWYFNTRHGPWGGKQVFCVINPEPMVDKKDASKDILLCSEFESLFDT